jgi:hypothetical protein
MQSVTALLSREGKSVAAAALDAGNIPAGAVSAALDKILSSESFHSCDRLSRVLRYVVEQTLDGRGDRLKEYSIAVDVLGRGDTFDPRTDSIVRVEASRLRAKLEAYYKKDGVADAVRIELPRGTYVPRICRCGCLDAPRARPRHPSEQREPVACGNRRPALRQPDAR